MAKATNPELHELAAAAGLARHWRDVDGCDQQVDDDALTAILDALGHETTSTRQIKASLARLAERGNGLPPMVVTDAGLPTPMHTRAISAELTDEDGTREVLPITDGQLAPIFKPGYYDMAIDRQHLRLAVAPRQCPLPTGDGRRFWGTSIQIPALRGEGAQAFGGFGELAGAVQTLGRLGCGAVAINPVHALFPGVGEDFSPYSPSSRTFLNTAMGDPALLGLPPLDSSPQTAELIDWPKAMPGRLAALRKSFAALGADKRALIKAASADEGPALHRHALFDALYCHFRALGSADWRAWPAEYRSPDSAAVQRFASENSEEVAIHLYAQWLAREGLDTAQREATAAGMAIGLVTDLAVGVHCGGSDCWSMPDTMLQGLTIGAPPDPLGPLGQNWSITGFSPDGLRSSGYSPWIAMLRSALRSAGGLRIDHAFGLARLWVIPAGGSSAQGAYLSYPFHDLLRLVTLEAHRASALIIAEDLGTSPHGFTEAVSERNMLGMRVLWFERAADNGFIGASDYPANSVAMTGTHDTPTVAGWWRGRDLDWADTLGRLPDDVDRQKAEEIRDWDRGLLWSTMAEGPRPAPDDPEPVVIAALDHVAKTPALLAIAPLEDLLAEAEQPNLPGTTTEHPNWRRRLSAPLDELLQEPQVSARVAAIANRN
ncbi:4-alpha-glucanotransferase [Erythrobacter sp. EC-HK427]|uniref:4-alpha-glucanotransferase n=1 Tax=Erythrobacter sp. EC-HK427 TaxID=2038396 RepID=UPI0012543328|nr:4-alpha-glucanotransferase [Erythrobacter sp. EC-HK427]VVT10910.1 4-alpha-glucanotransferase [Erythrobacter sp. EC-HK427]